MEKVIKPLLKMILTTLLVFITPFVLPLLLKIFIWAKFFEDIDEFEKIIKIFYNAYPIIYIILTIILLLWFFHKWDDIKTFFNSRDLLFKLGKNEISARRVEEALEKKEVNQKIIKEMSKEVENKEVIEEAKMELGLLTKTNINNLCEKCNKKEIENENDSLRYFAAYNLINVEAKGVLHRIYNENYIEKENFKNIIIQGYKRRNEKNIKFKKKDINKIADSKYETIYDGLKFLNIIEPSENDSEIKLTKTGKKFVEKYIEKKGEV